MAAADGVEKSNDVELGMVELKLSPTMPEPEQAVLVPRRSSKRLVLFERSAHAYWNPRFDSDLLEAYYRLISQQQTRRRFQYALGYIALSCISWCLFFGLIPKTPEQKHWIAFLIGTIVLLVITIVFLVFCFTNLYKRFVHPVSVVVALVLYLFNLLNYVYCDEVNISQVGTLIGSFEIIILTYAFIPLPLYGCVGLGFGYSLMFEILSGVLTKMWEPRYVIGRILLHLAVHVIGVYIFIVSQVRKRSTFLKVGQSIKSRRDLQTEKQFKHDMIHSLMPPKVAEDIMKSRENDRDRDANEDEVNGGKSRRPSQMESKGKMTFRSFHMSQMDNVSILFADIVGFTKMSSNKSAEHLVSLLNDLFGRFDDICSKCGCEKISTLGDCYYCVSGCPEPRPDHAKCCVEMGLMMCVAIKQFDDDHKEEVNMRVGVHTGTVLCGLVGTRRFKFDVWSHDVTIANLMESEGKPGRVHISEHTYSFVQKEYEVEKGGTIPDIRGHKTLIECFNSETQQYVVQHIVKTSTIDTWFIIARKSELEAPNGCTTNDLSIAAKTTAAKTTAVNSSDASNGDHLAVADGQVSEGDSLNTTNVESLKDASAVMLIGKRENISSCREEPSVEAASVNPAAVVTHLLLPKQPTDEADAEMIDCMNRCSDLEVYLYHPPINRCTLNFTNSKLERNYRSHYIDSYKTSKDLVKTLALSHISSLFDMIVSLVFFTLLSACCFVGFEVQAPLVAVFLIAVIIEILVFVPMLYESCMSGMMKPAVVGISRFFSGWLARHLIRAIVASLPTLVVYSAFSCKMKYLGDQFFCLVIIASLLHYCNFTMLSSWMKSSLALIAGAILLILCSVQVCSPPGLSWDGIGWVSANGTNGTDNGEQHLFYGGHILSYEVILNMLLVLVLITFINYDIEVGYRLCYHGDVQAVKDRKKIEDEKEQADWLLHNIVPEHVAGLLKQSEGYCKNHKDVGVIFAKISNFDDFYDESYEGGKEYLRVLNELIGDFEELFDDPKYRDVEKIKTIGSCLMAASGLNPQTRNQNKDPNAHLYALMDFLVDMLKKLDDFNKDIFNFEFEMKIGYNFGEVTAGVIGTKKLLYDIWGDTVNIASRMYSTGVHGKIQVTEDMAKKLGDKFDFEYRGQTYVKGKGDMNTYLFVGKKPGATWD